MNKDSESVSLESQEIDERLKLMTLSVLTNTQFDKTKPPQCVEWVEQNEEGKIVK